MREDNLDWVTKFLRYALFAFSAGFIVIYVIVALLRMGYPFELEWIEGSCVDHVIRILEGKTFYVSPSMEFTPFLYTPLYFYLSALVAKIIGIGFVPLRLVSFLASIGCFAVIYAVVNRETKSKYYSVLAAGMFAATFIIGGQWFDISRPDTLFVFFALVSVYYLGGKSSLITFVLAGLFLVLSFYTKQTALVIAIPMLIASYFASKRYFLYFIGIVVIGIGGGIIILDRIYDGWFSFYVFKMPAQHYILKGRYIYFWIQDLMYPLSVVCALAICFFYFMLRGETLRKGLFYLFMAAGFVGGAWSARIHSGAYLNTLLPVYAILSILFGLGLYKFLEYIKIKSSSDNSDIKKVFTTFLLLICAIQFGSLAYNPKYSVPKSYDVDAGRRLIKILSEIEGEVYFPGHGYLPSMAGKGSYAHVTAIHDITRGGETKEVAVKLMKEIEQSIRSQRFSAIVLDKEDFIMDIEPYYELKEKLFDISRDMEFFPITGLPTRPETIYVPTTDGE